MASAFYFVFALLALTLGALLLYIAWFPIYKLFGGGDTFLQYVDYFIRGPRL